MNAREYYLSLQAAIQAAPHVLRSELAFEEIDTNECYLRGVLLLVGNLELHVAEYTVTEPAVRREKYRYHLQTADGKLISRWDNVAHHPTVATFPDHRHDDQETSRLRPPWVSPKCLRQSCRSSHLRKLNSSSPNSTSSLRKIFNVAILARLAHDTSIRRAGRGSPTR